MGDQKKKKNMFQTTNQPYFCGAHAQPFMMFTKRHQVRSKTLDDQRTAGADVVAPSEENRGEKRTFEWILLYTSIHYG